MLLSAKRTPVQHGAVSAKSFFFKGLQSKPFHVFFLATVCLLVYWPVFFHEFQWLWDDHWVAMNEYTEDGLSPANLWRVLSEYYHGQYAPVNESYYILLYAMFGYDPFWFHTGSLLIHIANVLLLYFFISRLLEQSADFTFASVRRIAFTTALLLALHPFLVEAVAWVSASKIILYVFFYLVSLQCYLSYISSGKKQFYWCAVLFFIVSFGAKEQAVVMPCCLLLIDRVLKRDLGSRKIWLEKAPFFALALFFGILTMLSQASDGGGVLSGEKTYPFYQNIVLACYTFTEYFVKCLVPVKLLYIYPFPNLPGEPLPLRFWIYPVMVIIAAVGLFNFWKQKWVLFGMGFFIIHLLVVLNIIPMSRFAIVADRYVYLASAGIFFLLSFFLDRAVINKVKYIRPLVILAGLYVISLGIYARQRSNVWRDSHTLKEEMREMIKSRKDYEANKDKL